MRLETGTGGAANIATATGRTPKRLCLADPRFVPRRILLVSPNPLGDAVMAEPAMRAVAGRFPDASIDVMTPQALTGLGEAMPFARRVVGLPFGAGFVARWRRLGVFVRQATTRYDLCVLFPNSLASARFARLAGIPRVVGYARNGRARFLTDAVSYEPAVGDREHMVRYYGRIGDAFAPWPAGEAADLDLRPSLVRDARTRPTLRPTPRALSRAAELLEASNPYVVLAPGAAYGGAKRWPVEHFARLARLIVDGGRRVVLAGGPGDRVLADAIVADARIGAPHLLDLCERTDLSTSIAVIAGAAGFVGNDSGPAHIAAALARPGVTLFGSSSISRSGPVGTRMRVMSIDLECAPCFQRECPLGHLGCLTGIEPASVFEHLTDAMSGQGS